MREKLVRTRRAQLSALTRQVVSVPKRKRILFLSALCILLVRRINLPVDGVAWLREGQENPDCRTFADLAFHFDLSIVIVDNALND